MSSNLERSPHPPTGSKSEPPSQVEREILRAVEGLAYGSVEIVVHDSKVVQIERKEKVRFN
ncbi:MAG TPA: YezD family protein [bacterium]|nr:YezD family protein [bacterium]